MSAPEMPAKEVSPEFGFREASPTVAAAALAALKTGGAGPNGRRTRGGRAGAGPLPSEEPPAENACRTSVRRGATAEAGEEARRRRRRRGGRGRGRSRRDEERPLPPRARRRRRSAGRSSTTSAQLDGAPEAEREYTFEEADAATLAELGIEPSTTSHEPTRRPQEKPKRRTRSTAKPADGDAEKPKSRPRRSTTKPAADVDGRRRCGGQGRGEAEGRTRTTTKAASDAAPKSKPRARSSTAKPATNPAEPAATSDSSAQPLR